MTLSLHDDRVKALVVEVTVVLKPQFHRQVGTDLAPQSKLFIGDIDTDNDNRVSFCRKACEASKTAADIEDTHVLLQMQLPAHEVELLLLSLVEV